MSAVAQVLIEIIRCKLSRSLCLSSSRKVELYAEGIYGKSSRKRIFKSKICRLQAGIVVCIPWDTELNQIIIHFSSLDEIATSSIGKTSVDVQAEIDEDPRDHQLFITTINGKTNVGNILLRTCKQTLFCNDETEAAAQFRMQKVILEDEMKMRNPIPKFKFKRLSRPINWDKIRALSIPRITKTVDVATVLSCLPDVTTGDISQEEVDPYLQNAVRMAQFSVQYLNSCQEVMKSRQQTIKSALATFDEEEELLDFEIAKYKARERAMRRENRSLDSICRQYLEVLDALDPKASRNYKEQVADQAHLEASHLRRSISERELSLTKSLSTRKTQSQSITDNVVRGSRRHASGWEVIAEAQEDAGSDVTSPPPNALHDKRSDGDLRRSRSHDIESESSDNGDSVKSHNPPSYQWRKGTLSKKALVSLGSPAGRTEESRASDGPGLANSPSASSVSDLEPFEDYRVPRAVSTVVGAKVAVSQQANIDTTSTSNRRGSSWEANDMTNARHLVSAQQYNQHIPKDSVHLQKDEEVHFPHSLNQTKQSLGASNTVISVDSLAFEPPRQHLGDLSKHESSVFAPGAHGDDVVIFDSMSLSESNLNQAPTNSRTLVSTSNTLTPSPVPLVSNLNAAKVVVPAPINKYRRHNGFNFDDESDEENDRPTEGSSAPPSQTTSQAPSSSPFRNSRGTTPLPSNVGDNDLEKEKLISDGIANRHGSKSPQWEVDGRVSNGIRESGQHVKIVQNPKAEVIESWPAEYPTSSLSVEPTPKIGATAGIRGVQSPPVAPIIQRDSSQDLRAYFSQKQPTHGTPGDNYDQDDFEDDTSPYRPSGRIVQPRDAISQVNSAAKQRLYPTQDSMPRRSVDSSTLDYKLQMKEQDDVFERSMSVLDESSIDRFEQNLTVKSFEASVDIDTSRSVIIGDNDDDYRGGNQGKHLTSYSSRQSDGPTVAQPWRTSFGRAPAIYSTSEDDDPYASHQENTQSTRGSWSHDQPAVSRQHVNQSQRDEDTVDDEEVRSSIIDYLQHDTIRKSPSDLLRQNGRPSSVANYDDGNYNVMDVKSGATKIEEPGFRTNQIRRQANPYDDEDEEVLFGTTRFSQGTGSSRSSKLSPGDQNIDMDVSWEEESRPEPVTALGKPTTSRGPGADNRVRDSYNNAQTHSEAAKKDPTWQGGRASLDLIETAQAMDIFISTFRLELDAEEADLPMAVRIKVDFAGILSDVSNVILTRSRSHIPVNFSAHIIADESIIPLIKREIKRHRDYLSLSIHLVDEGNTETIAMATLNLWVMIEDSCNLPLQEAEVVTPDETVLGQLIIDVRGTRLLKQCL